MYRLFFWHHHQSSIKNRGIRYGRMALRLFSAMMFVLATGGWTAPVAVVAAPSTPTGGATFNITWSVLPGCEPLPAEAVNAFDYATDLWGTWISSTVPISVTVYWMRNPSGGDALGTGMPTEYISNFPGAPLVNTAYPIALANALNGSDLYPTLGDMTLQFKCDADWSYVTTTTRLTAPTETYDFVAVALHELAHGLGFIGNMYESSGVGFCGDGLWGPLYPCPTPYDQFVVDGAGVPLLDYYAANDRYALAARLTGDAHFGGPNAIAAYGGSLKVYTPADWEWGSSLSHLDSTTFQGSPNRLMTPSYSGVTRHPGAATLGIFQDMGWLRVDGVPNLVTSGPRIVGAGQVVTLTGDLVWFAYTGQPITYTWTATEQMTTTHPSLITTDIVTYTWDAPGEKALTLTLTDGVAFAGAVRTMLAFAANVDGATAGKTGRAYIFTADVTLDGYPVTYTWEATGQTPATSGDDSVTFTWPMSGTQTITVTAVIEGAPTQAVHTIDIEETVYRYIYLPLVQRTF